MSGSEQSRMKCLSCAKRRKMYGKSAEKVFVFEDIGPVYVTITPAGFVCRDCLYKRVLRNYDV